MKAKKTKKVKYPAHLKAESGRWYRYVIENFELEPRHIKLLVLACESFDRCNAARKRIAKKGLTFTDRFGAPHCRPEVKIELDSRQAFCKILRELGLDFDEPDGKRLPGINRSILRK